MLLYDVIQLHFNSFQASMQSALQLLYEEQLFTDSLFHCLTHQEPSLRMKPHSVFVLSSKPAAIVSRDPSPTRSDQTVSNPQVSEDDNDDDETLPKLTTSSCYLYNLPNELLHLILSNFTIRDHCLLSLCSPHLYEICQHCIIASIKRYDCKDQFYDIHSLEHLLKRGNLLESINIARASPNELVNGVYPYPINDTTMSLLTKRNCHALRSLTIRGCDNITEAGFRKIDAACSKLVVLNLSFLRHLTPSAMQAIVVSNPFLRCIYLERSYNAVNDTVLHAIATSCSHLRTLSLSYCIKITDRGLEYLADGCTMLRDLNLAHCTELTSYGISRLVQANTWLKVLSLEWCVNVTDQVIYTLADHCKQLEALGIEHCTMVTDEALAYIPASLNKLTFLSADSCGFIGNVTCWALSSHLNTIKDLYVNNCTLINDNSMDILTSNCHKLVHLGIEECSVTDVAVKLLADRCPLLITVGLNGNKPITDDSVIYFIDHIPAIERFYLSQTSITNKALIAIAEKSTNLISLSLVDCNINYVGLMKLGQSESLCHTTLKDIHISACLQYSRYFYGDSFREVMMMQYINGQAYFNDHVDPVPLLPLPLTLQHLQQDNTTEATIETSDEDIQSSMSLQRSDITVLDQCLGGVLNLQDIIFPVTHRLKKQCTIFLR